MCIANETDRRKWFCRVENRKRQRFCWKYGGAHCLLSLYPPPTTFQLNQLIAAISASSATFRVQSKFNRIENWRSSLCRLSNSDDEWWAKTSRLHLKLRQNTSPSLRCAISRRHKNRESTLSTFHGNKSLINQKIINDIKWSVLLNAKQYHAIYMTYHYSRLVYIRPTDFHFNLHSLAKIVSII